MADTAYLVEHPPARRQYRERYGSLTGLIVMHTAESAPDTVGLDGGAQAVADFIRRRSDPGSYHLLADSDSYLLLVPLALAAYGDGTGSNEFAVHVSAATQAHRWDQLPEEWVAGCIEQLAQAAARAARWLLVVHDIRVPARRVTREESERGLPGFISHGERDPGRRSDPGASFPWERFLARFAQLTQEDTMTPYTQWKPEDRKALAADVAGAVMTEPIKIRAANGKPKTITVRQALARAANGPQTSRDVGAEILDALDDENR